MKNVFKKISAIAMAFTLLGAGTTIAKNVNPKSVSTLTASAASDGWTYLGTWQGVAVVHFNGQLESYTYNKLSVWKSGNMLKMSTPSVPVTIYAYSVKTFYLIEEI